MVDSGATFYTWKSGDSARPEGSEIAWHQMVECENESLHVMIRWMKGKNPMGGVWMFARRKRINGRRNECGVCVMYL